MILLTPVLVTSGFHIFDTSNSINKPIYASAINGDTVSWINATSATV